MEHSASLNTCKPTSLDSQPLPKGKLSESRAQLWFLSFLPHLSGDSAHATCCQLLLVSGLYRSFSFSQRQVLRWASGSKLGLWFNLTIEVVGGCREHRRGNSRRSVYIATLYISAAFYKMCLLPRAGPCSLLGP